MLSAITNTPELGLSQPEAQGLASALHEVDKLYGRKYNAKALAWANLTMVAGTIYGLRAVAIGQRVKGNRTRNVTPRQTEPERPRSQATGAEMNTGPAADFSAATSWESRPAGDGL